MGGIWPLFGRHDVILIMCDFENYCCKPQGKYFWTCYLPSCSLILPEIFMEECGNQLLLSSRRPERKPSLDGVQCGLLLVISPATHLCCIIAYNQNSQPVHTLWEMKSPFNFVFIQITAMKNQFYLISNCNTLAVSV